MPVLTNSRSGVCAVAWEVTDRCNFQCWYCPETLHAGSSRWPDAQIALRYFNFLLKQHPDGVFIDMLGGEPTLWPQMTEFAENLPEGIDCEVTTNGSRTLRWWERVGPRLKRVTISHHLASASDDHLIALVKILQPITHLNVMILLDPQYRERAKKVHVALCDLDVSHDTKPIFPGFKGVMLDYTDEDMEMLRYRHMSSKIHTPDRKPDYVWLDGVKTKARDLIISGQNRFTGWFCRAGSRKVHIDATGNVWAGSCRVQSLGNMTELPLLRDPLTCTKNTCTCIDDVKIEKWSK